MTRSRLAATAALSIAVVLVPITGGEAGTGPVYKAVIKDCFVTHPMNSDFVTTETKVTKNQANARAAAFRPAAGVKVVGKLIDLTPQNGNNVVGKARRSDKTNDKGVAKITHQFNNFGNYRVKVKARVGGVTVARDRIDFGVGDRVDGPCGPPITGRP
jgi:hypothetical protein